jgi:hypothetical protein
MKFLAYKAADPSLHAFLGARRAPVPRARRGVGAADDDQTQCHHQHPRGSGDRMNPQDRRAGGIWAIVVPVAPVASTGHDGVRQDEGCGEGCDGDNEEDGTWRGKFQGAETGCPDIPRGTVRACGAVRSVSKSPISDPTGKSGCGLFMGEVLRFVFFVSYILRQGRRRIVVHDEPWGPVLKAWEG